MIKIKDGRTELYQWDTGSILTVGEGIDEVHFARSPMGRSITAPVANGEAKVEDVLLQTAGKLFVWGFVGTAEDGYTKLEREFTVRARNKPADYVFTPPEQITLSEILEELKRVQDVVTPEAVGALVEEYLRENPVEESVSIDSTLTKEGYAADAAAVGREVNQLSKAIDDLPQADMAQNDPTAPDYVKNRLAWTDDPVETVLIAETTNEWTALGFDGALTLAPIEITEGTTYKVNWDGTLYECVSYMAQEGMVVVGNDVVGEVGDTGGKGEPFFITVFEGSTIVFADSVGSHTFEVVGYVAEVHKIDEKYLPEIKGETTVIQLTSFIPFAWNAPDGFEEVIYNITEDEWKYFYSLCCNSSIVKYVGDYPMYSWIDDGEEVFTIICTTDVAMNDTNISFYSHRITFYYNKTSETVNAITNAKSYRISITQ